MFALRCCALDLGCQNQSLSGGHNSGCDAWYLIFSYLYLFGICPTLLLRNTAATGHCLWASQKLRGRRSKPVQIHFRWNFTTANSNNTEASTNTNRNNLWEIQIGQLENNGRGGNKTNQCRWNLDKNWVKNLSDHIVRITGLVPKEYDHHVDSECWKIQIQIFTNTNANHFTGPSGWMLLRLAYTMTAVAGGGLNLPKRGFWPLPQSLLQQQAALWNLLAVAILLINCPTSFWYSAFGR